MSGHSELQKFLDEVRPDETRAASYEVRWHALLVVHFGRLRQCSCRLAKLELAGECPECRGPGILALMTKDRSKP